MLKVWAPCTSVVNSQSTSWVNPNQLLIRWRDGVGAGEPPYGAAAGKAAACSLVQYGRYLSPLNKHRNDDEQRAERLLYRAVLSPLTRVHYEFMINEVIVEVSSQAHIYDMIFDRAGKELAFTAAGPTGGESQTTVLVPSALLQGQVAVFIDGTEVRSWIVGERIIFNHIHTGRTDILINARQHDAELPGLAV